MAYLRFGRDISDVGSHLLHIGSEPVGGQYRISSASYPGPCLTFSYSDRYLVGTFPLDRGSLSVLAE